MALLEPVPTLGVGLVNMDRTGSIDVKTLFPKRKASFILYGWYAWNVSYAWIGNKASLLIISFMRSYPESESYFFLKNADHTSRMCMRSEILIAIMIHEVTYPSRRVIMYIFLAFSYI